MKKNFLILIMFMSAIVLISCGGGGGGGTTTTSTSATPITSATAAKTADAAVSVFSLTGSIGALGGAVAKTSADSPAEGRFISAVIGKALSIQEQGRTNTLNKVVTDSCTNGGDVTVTVSGTTLTAVFNSCVEGAESINGTMSVSVSSQDSNSMPTAGMITLTGFTYKNTGDNTDITANMTWNYTFTWSGTTLTAMTIEMTGSISGTAEGEPVNFEASKLTLAASENSSGQTLSLSGSMKPVCINQTITITTTTPIFVPAGSNCPTAGELSISAGTSTVTAVISSDKKINIYFNGEFVVTYTDCSSFDGLCT